MIHEILLAYHKGYYHCRLLLQFLFSRLYIRKVENKNRLPEVTLFISSFNTLHALQVTLGSLEKTNQKRDKLIIADNQSTDGSLEFLREYAKNRPWVELIENPNLKLHGIWIDEILKKCETKYLFFIDSDILFFGEDLVSQCVAYMESNPDCQIFESEERIGGTNGTNPKTICEEAISTWFFCIRTSVREKVKESFLILYAHEQPEIEGMKVISDTGAKFLKEMKRQSLKMHIFPWSMRFQFHHFGSLSWLYMVKEENRWVQMKRYQLKDLERLSKTYKQYIE